MQDIRNELNRIAEIEVGKDTERFRKINFLGSNLLSNVRLAELDDDYRRIGNQININEEIDRIGNYVNRDIGKHKFKGSAQQSLSVDRDKRYHCRNATN